jgi:Ca2+-binding RTX toxin-like protein
MAIVNGTAGKDFIHRAGDGKVAPAGYNDITGVTTGSDHVNGGAGDDILFGDDGNDFLYGGLGADTLDGGAGFDQAYYGAAAAGIVVNLTNPASNTGEAAGDAYISIEALAGSAFNDTLTGDANNNNLNGNAGNDVLNGLAGNDFLNGGLGADVLNGGDGYDTATYAGATSGVTASLTNPGVNTGEAAGDTYISIEALVGTSFNDTLIGDGGTNFLSGGLGADSLIGGGGFDFADYFFATSAVAANLTNPTVNTGEAAGDTYTSIHGLSGSNFNDTLIGDANTNVLRGNQGADVLNGMGGFDYADYGISKSGITASLANSAINTGEASGDTYISIEGLIGSKFNDTLIGDGGNNNLRGGLGADVLNGGGGFDYAEYVNATSGITASLANPAINTGEAAGDTYISIEGLRGSNFNDTLIGDSNNNNLRGGLGADVLNGGAGFDNAGYNNSTTGVRASLANPASNTGEAAGDTYISIEGLIGSAFNDTLIGDSHDNILRGDLGADVLNGGGGFDYASYSNSATGVRASLANPASNTGEAAGDTYTSIEGLIGSKFNDTLIGDGNDNFLRGGLGADVLNGGGGQDYADYIDSPVGLTVSLANPSINTGEAAGDTYTSIEKLRGSNFNDKLIGDAHDNTLRGGLGADTLNGGAGFDFASYAGSAAGLTASLASPASNTGEAAGDTYISIEGLRGSNFNDKLTGDAHDNFLQGELGADTLNGGAGFDYADYVNATSGVTASLANPASNTGEAAGDTYTSIEGLRGSKFNDKLIGNGSNNYLRGGLGADTLNGAGGFDVADYKNATSGVTANLANPALNTGEAAGDTYTSIEGLRGSGFNDTLTGNGAANSLEGDGGNDRLTGGGGADKFVYQASGNGTDIITDFSGHTAFGGGAGQDDKLTFQNLLHGTFAYRGGGAFTGTGNTEARVQGGNVYVDVDGNGAADFHITLTGLTSPGQLVAGDFLVS